MGFFRIPALYVCLSVVCAVCTAFWGSLFVITGNYTALAWLLFMGVCTWWNGHMALEMERRRGKGRDSY